VCFQKKGSARTYITAGPAEGAESKDGK